MAWSGSGTFSRVFGASGWTNDKNNGVKILASRHDTNDQDLADGINACLTRNNEAKPTSDFLPSADNTLSLGSASFRWLLNAQSPALLGQVNTFTTVQTGLTYPIVLSSTQPGIALNETDGAANNRLWDFILLAEQLRGRVKSDDGNTAADWLEVDRTLNVIDSINLLTLQLRANGIHNGTTPSGVANQYIASGTYTPTITNSTNVTSSTARLCQWMRVGNVVTVSGSLNITETNGASVTAFDISLPLATNIGNTFELGGFCAGDLVSTGRGGPVVGNTAQDRAAAKYLAQNASATAEEVSFQFTYLML